MHISVVIGTYIFTSKSYFPKSESVFIAMVVSVKFSDVNVSTYYHHCLNPDLMYYRKGQTHWPVKAPGDLEQVVVLLSY